MVPKHNHSKSGKKVKDLNLNSSTSLKSHLRAKTKKECLSVKHHKQLLVRTQQPTMSSRNVYWMSTRSWSTIKSHLRTKFEITTETWLCSSRNLVMAALGPSKPVVVAKRRCQAGLASHMLLSFQTKTCHQDNIWAYSKVKANKFLTISRIWFKTTVAIHPKQLRIWTCTNQLS
jgi:hypothetical protein